MTDRMRGRARPRKIIHVDMDAFYASVEQRDHPEYRARPVVVGGTPESRGVVAACSYEARRFGIHSAMPAVTAVRLCPDAVFVRPRFTIYHQVSRQIHAILSAVTPLIEPLALDEAYLDVSASTRHRGSATLIARAIKSRIHAELELRASAGISYNKFLAKVASDMDKPDGLFVITPAQGEAFVAGLPIGRFPGVGPVTEKRLKGLGISTGAHLQALSLEALRPLFGTAADYYFSASRGVDERPVHSSRETKSVSAETTFATDLLDVGQMLASLGKLADDVAGSLQRNALLAYTLTIKVRYDNFQLVTRSRTLQDPLSGSENYAALLRELLGRTEAGIRPVRLLGVAASNLISRGRAVEQLGLF